MKKSKLDPLLLERWTSLRGNMSIWLKEQFCPSLYTSMVGKLGVVLALPKVKRCLLLIWNLKCICSFAKCAGFFLFLSKERAVFSLTLFVIATFLSWQLNASKISRVIRINLKGSLEILFLCQQFFYSEFLPRSHFLVTCFMIVIISC